MCCYCRVSRRISYDFMPFAMIKIQQGITKIFKDNRYASTISKCYIKKARKISFTLLPLKCAFTGSTTITATDNAIPLQTINLPSMSEIQEIHNPKVIRYGPSVTCLTDLSQTKPKDQPVCAVGPDM